MTVQVVVDNPEGLIDTLARRVECEATRVLTAHGRFALALAGGSVATTFFPRLSRLALDWSRCEFFWCDERALPHSDPESNFGLARSLWLDPAGVPAERAHPMEAASPHPQLAAAAYEDSLVRLLGTPPRLDLVLLGVGPDGHVCSLFPGHALLREQRRFVGVVEDAPKPPPRRMTLTLPTLAAAELVVVVMLGAAKADVARRVLDAHDASLPATQLLGRARRCLVLVDRGAARLLRKAP